MSNKRVRVFHPHRADDERILATRTAVAAAMAAAKLNQKQLARQSGVPQSAISKVRTGQQESLSTDNLQAIAKTLGTTTSALLGETAATGKSANAARRAVAPDLALTSAGLQDIPWERIGRSELNPRRTFDPDELQRLADSIFKSGILQNLVVRPSAKHGHFEIAAGERRWRAFGLLVDDGRFTRTDVLPCLVSDLTDAELLEIALIENVDRQDVPPMEEAEGLARLFELRHAEFGGALTIRDFAKLMASRLGRTVRFVELRLDLVNKLAPGAQAALRENRISLAQARAMTVGEPKDQVEALEHIERGWADTPERIKHLLTRDIPGTDWAAFDLDAYDGGFIEDPDNPDVRWFADKAQALKLQREAIDALIAEHKDGTAGWAFVKVYWKAKGQYFESWKFRQAKKKEKGGIAIIVGENLSLETREGIVKEDYLGGGAATASGKKQASGGDKPPPQPATTAHWQHARRRKTAALQTEIAGEPMAAMRLTCLALMGGQDCVHIKPVEHGSLDANSGSHLPAEPVAQVLDRFAGFFGKVKDSSTTPLQVGGDHWPDDKQQLAAWQALHALSDDDVNALFAALVAARCGTFNGYGGELGAPPSPCSSPRTSALPAVRPSTG